MTSFHAFRFGWPGAWRARSAAVLFWMLYSLVAAIVAAPAAFLLIQPLAHSRLGQTLVEHFDLAWVMELTPLGDAAIGMLTAGAIVAALLTWLLGVLLAGGALAGLYEGWPHFTLERFSGAAGRYFWRLFRLSLFGLPCYALAALIAHLPLMVARKVYGEGMEAAPVAIARIVSMVLTVILLGLAGTALDYAKLRLIGDDVRGAFKALLHGFRFFVRHFVRTANLWAMNGILFLAVGLVYLMTTNALTGASYAVIGATLVLQQLFIFFRVFLRLAGWGGAAALYAALRPLALPPEEPIGVAVPVGETPPTFEAGAEAGIDFPSPEEE
jgi:hypothetical protein